MNRPVWGRLIEALDENPTLRSADLVACVSSEVAEEISRRGVPKERILVTPCGVDLDMFAPAADGSPDEIRTARGLDDRPVVGWIGSFRRFHGLELVLEAMAHLEKQVPEVSLLLVGDGLERPRIEQKIHDLALNNVVLTGTVEYSRIPAHIRAMDVAVVSAGGSQFHYSPLKLREYMACARAVVAPRVGELESVITHGVDGLLVEPGSPESLAGAVQRLLQDDDLRSRVGSAARGTALKDSSWDDQLQRAEERLGQIVPGYRLVPTPTISDDQG